MKTLETERLTIRPWVVDDAGDLYEYARDPEVGPAAGWAPHAGPEVSAEIVRHFIERGDVWALELKENGKVIGSVGLHGDRRREGVEARMVGYVLSRDYWGRGLMTEAVRRVMRFAFEEMGLAILSVSHYPFNSRSARVIEKCGFRREGTLRMASRIYDGRIYDDVCYSMTAEEFRASDHP